VLRAPVSVPRHGAIVAQEGQAKLPFFLDIETKGGIIFWSVVGIGAPFFVYNFLQEQLGMDVVRASILQPYLARSSRPCIYTPLPAASPGYAQVGAGNVILVGYVGIGVLAWTSTYVFRVANKDMTYAKQLRDYENAVIQKRFEELNTDQVDALMDEIYPEKPKEPPK
jgi:hypothetical protein